jgi:dihydrofolate synthase/folylpolyglutamate synthase
LNYPDSVRFLYALGNELKTAKFGLERIARLMAELGDPQRRPARFIHVAGTNGKGSTCAMIERGLRAAGFRTGLLANRSLLMNSQRLSAPFMTYRNG